MVQVGWKDFKSRIKLHGPNDAQEGDMAKKLAEVMTEVFKAGDLDTDVQKMLEQEMGIDIKKVLDEQGERGLESALQTFFSKNTTQIDKFIKRQFKSNL